jgi:hypothetical protein
MISLVPATTFSNAFNAFSNFFRKNAAALGNQLPNALHYKNL